MRINIIRGEPLLQSNNGLFATLGFDLKQKRGGF
jgi:hypothetical protein